MSGCSAIGFSSVKQVHGIAAIPINPDIVSPIAALSMHFFLSLIEGLQLVDSGVSSFPSKVATASEKTDRIPAHIHRR